MSYFNYDGIIDPKESFVLKGSEATHMIQSRRLQPGERVKIQDSSENRFLAEIVRQDRRKIILNVITELIPPPESRLHLTLVQALVKEKAADFIIQKATELGVTNVVFAYSQFSQRLKKGEMMEKKLERWQKIAVEACKQSERVNPPSLFFLPELEKFDQFCRESSIKTHANLCLESSPDSIPIHEASLDNGPVCVFVGPEGGWSDTDLQALPCQKIQLGPRVLRSDTAAVTIAAILQYLRGDMGTAP